MIQEIRTYEYDTRGNMTKETLQRTGLSDMLHPISVVEIEWDTMDQMVKKTLTET